VKRFLKTRSAAGRAVSRLLPGEVMPRAPSFELVTKKALRPSEDETARNPRARSARLRAGKRTENPPWPRTASAGEEAA